MLVFYLRLPDYQQVELFTLIFHQSSILLFCQNVFIKFSALFIIYKYRL